MVVISNEDFNKCLPELPWMSETNFISKAIAEESERNTQVTNRLGNRISILERNNKLLLNELVTLRLDKMEERLSQLRKAIPVYPVGSTIFNQPYM